MKVNHAAVFRIADEADAADAKPPAGLTLDDVRAEVARAQAEALAALPALIEKAVADALPHGPVASRSPKEAEEQLRRMLRDEVDQIIARPSPLHENNQLLANELYSNPDTARSTVGWNPLDVYDAVAQSILAGVVRLVEPDAASEPAPSSIETTRPIDTDPYRFMRQQTEPGPLTALVDDGSDLAVDENGVQPPLTLSLARRQPFAARRFLAAYRPAAEQNQNRARLFRLAVFTGR
ncbi:MAG: hypothetical protein U0871_29500, partial [Gemmataceae bacterium]